MSKCIDDIIDIGRGSNLLRYKLLSAAVSSFLLIGTMNVAYASSPVLQEKAFIIQPDIQGEVKATYARSTVDRLNVRTKPNLTASIVEKIGKSKKYEVLDTQEEWVKIKLSDDSSGWVFHQYIEYEKAKPASAEVKPAGADSTETQPAAGNDTPQNQATVVNIVDVTNLRSGPGTEYDITGKAQPGETYPIVETEGDWYLVTLPDQSTAYVASWVVQTDFLSRNGIAIPPAITDAEFAPALYIYHTHNQESWKNIARNTKGTSVDDPEVNITLVGKHLSQLLQEKGIPALAGEEDITKRLKEENLNFSQSYKVSRKAVEKAMQEHPSLSYFFDIHRDANVPREKTTATIDGKAYARILFVIGTAHAGYEENKAFAEALNELLNEKYPGLSRGILTKSVHQGNGEYNQSLSPGSLLMEIGGTNNTLQESLHAAEAIADVFAEYYGSRDASAPDKQLAAVKATKRNA